jgi:hypothetical protein
MSRADHAVSAGPVNVPPGYDRRRVRRLNLTALVTIPACLAAGAFELSRALGGNQLSWVYAAEWPVIAGYVIYMWRRLVREPARGDDGTPSPSRGEARAEPGPEGAARVADPELAAWRDYLARLHAEQPPGGPPGCA